MWGTGVWVECTYTKKLEEPHLCLNFTYRLKTYNKSYTFLIPQLLTSHITPQYSTIFCAVIALPDITTASVFRENMLSRFEICRKQELCLRRRSSSVTTVMWWSFAKLLWMKVLQSFVWNWKHLFIVLLWFWTFLGHAVASDIGQPLSVNYQ